MSFISTVPHSNPLETEGQKSYIPQIGKPDVTEVWKKRVRKEKNV
jgi:hypothetical protein